MNPDLPNEQTRRFYYASVGMGIEASLARKFEKFIRDTYLSNAYDKPEKILEKFVAAVDNLGKAAFGFALFPPGGVQPANPSAGGGFVTSECLTFSQIANPVLFIGTISGGSSFVSAGATVLVGVVPVPVPSPDHFGEVDLHIEYFGTVLGGLGLSTGLDPANFKVAVSIGGFWWRD